jgi:aspartate/methionine/tyrosine aminotransferase
MEDGMGRFPENDIISLVASSPRFDLAESVGPNLQLAELLGSSGDEIGAMQLAYGTAEGDARLRNAIARRYGVTPEDVVVTVGGVHALFLLAFILCGEGGEAVAATPLFPPARSSLDIVGAKVTPFELSFARGYLPDIGDLRRLLTPQTRLVSLASPQNPSGVAIPQATLHEIVSAMAELCPQAHLLVDETYREAVFGDDPVAPSAVALGPKVISIASLSKCHGAPGLRIGWVVTRDAELRRQLVLGKFNTVISCSPLDEALAVKVLEDESRMPGRNRHLAEGVERVASFVTRNSQFVEWVRPDAGALCCVRLKPSAFDDAAVARFHEALAKAGARVANGTWFGDEERVFRLGFGLLPMDELAAALDVLSGVLRQTARAAA